VSGVGVQDADKHWSTLEQVDAIQAIHAGNDGFFFNPLSQPVIVKRLVLYGWLQGVAVLIPPT